MIKIIKPVGGEIDPDNQTGWGWKAKKKIDQRSCTGDQGINASGRGE
jgi:hypothetical protein